MNIKKSILIAGIILFVITISLPAFSGSSYRRGTTYRSKNIQISVESKRIENQKSGLIWFIIKADVKNLTSRAINVNVCFKAIDHKGSEIKEICFYDQSVKRRENKRLSKKTVIDARDYKNIKEWKIIKIR